MNNWGNSFGTGWFKNNNYYNHLFLRLKYCDLTKLTLVQKLIITYM